MIARRSFNLDLKSILVTATLFVSVIPQIIHINWIVTNNILSGDWYLARQLLSVAKNRISEFDLIPFASFIDPINSKSIFGNLSYSNGLQILTPDILFYKFMPDNFVFVFHFLFVILVAIIYIAKLAETYKFDLSQTVLFGIVWLNCGPLVARLSEGHIQSMGYYLIPGFFYHIFLIRTNSSLHNYAKLGFFLGFVLLLGSTHVYFQMCLIGLFLTILNLKKILMSIITLLISIVSSAVQALPIFVFPNFVAFNRSVYEGYGYHFIEKYLSLTIQSNEFEFLREIIGVPLHLLAALADLNSAIKLSGWEWTLYIGLLPTFFCLLSIWNFRTNVGRLILKNLYLIPVFLLSLSLIYRLLFISLSELINFVAVDRVPYRMMLYILFPIWFFTCSKIPDLLKAFYDKNYLKGIIIFFSYLNLLKSTDDWFSRHNQAHLKKIDYVISSQKVEGYESFIYMCLVVTLLSWTLFIFITLKNKMKSGVFV